MLDCVDIDARSQFAGDGLAFCSFDDFPNGEINPIGMLAMEQGSGDPNFIGDANVRGLSDGHTVLLRITIILGMEELSIQR
jgi:hypothetical protein